MSRYFLTARALQNIADIKHYSLQEFGEKTTKTYLDRLQQGFQKIAKNPEIGRLRHLRSAPFFMAPVEKHFVIYDIGENGIFIVAVLHQRQDIESIITKFADKLAEDIDAL